MYTFRMNKHMQKHRNEPFRQWVNKFPVSERVPVMTEVSALTGKTLNTIKAYRGLTRKITASDSVAIQAATRLIATEKKIDCFVSASEIYPELFDAFVKQGESNGLETQPNGKECQDSTTGAVHGELAPQHGQAA